MCLSSQTRTIRNSDMCNSVHNKEGNKLHDKKKQSYSHNIHITKPILESRTQMYIFPFYYELYGHTERLGLYHSCCRRYDNLCICKEVTGSVWMAYNRDLGCHPVFHVLLDFSYQKKHLKDKFSQNENAGISQSPARRWKAG